MLAPYELVVDGEAERCGRVDNLEGVGIDGETGRREVTLGGVYMHDDSPAGVESYFVVDGLCVETIKEEVEMIVVRVDDVDVGGKGGVV